MKKLLLVGAMLALVAVVAVAPALAQNNRFEDRFENRFERFQDRFGDDFFEDFFFDNFDNADAGVVSQEIGQEAQSGDVSMSFDVSSTGDYASQCVAPMQFGNTGNLQNAQGFVQYGSTADDIAFEGSSFEFSPTMLTSCDQAVQQSAAASSW